MQCIVCGCERLTNPKQLCAKCIFKVNNWERVCNLLNECVDLITTACPDSSVWTDNGGLGDEVDAFCTETWEIQNED